MDQAASADQGVLRHVRKRRQIANLGCRIGLRAGRDGQETPRAAPSLYEILQILSLTLFEKTPVNGLFDGDQGQKYPAPDPNQLNLFR